MSDDTNHDQRFNPDDVLPFDQDAADDEASRGLEFLYDGRGFTADEFTAYVQTYDFGKVPPDFVVLHHTYKPGLGAAAEPGSQTWDAGEGGMSAEQVRAKRKRQLDNLRDIFQTKNGWNRGPHLFVDNHFIWVFTPMYNEGIHAKWGNQFRSGGKLHYSIGIEVIGYYEHMTWSEPVAHLVGHAVAVLQRRLGTFDLSYMYANALDKPGMLLKNGVQLVAHPERLRFGGLSSHRDYNKPACPGAAISEEFYLGVVRQAAERLGAG